MSRRLALAMLAVVFVASGAYLIIYLMRWEWHRAIIAGLIFIGAELALVAGALLSRLRAIERRLDERRVWEMPIPADVRARIEEAAPPPRQPFAWLTRDADRFNVFLPVLLGAGLLASAAAWLVEALARATARPALEKDLAARLGPLCWPAGGLLGQDEPRPMVARHRFGSVFRLSAVLVAVGGTFFGIQAVADALQTRPERSDPDVQTSIDLQLHGSRLKHGSEGVGHELWAACRLVLSRPLPYPVVLPLDDHRVRLILNADLGRYAATRLRGCLEDAHIDHLQAGVMAVTRRAAD